MAFEGRRPSAREPYGARGGSLFAEHGVAPAWYTCLHEYANLHTARPDAPAPSHRRGYHGRQARRRDARLHALPRPVRNARRSGLRCGPDHLVVPALGKGPARHLEDLLPGPSLQRGVHRRAGLHAQLGPAAHPQPPRGGEEPARALRAHRGPLLAHLLRDPAQRRGARVRGIRFRAQHPLCDRYQRPVARGHAHGGEHPRAQRRGVLPVRPRCETRLPAALRRRRNLG